MIMRLCSVALLSCVAFAQQTPAPPPTGTPETQAPPPRVQVERRKLPDQARQKSEAQQRAQARRFQTFGPDGKGNMIYIRRGAFGDRWWKDAETVKNLGLSDAQVQRLDQIDQDYRLKSIDARAALEREEVKLQPLMEADNPDEAKTLAQMDKVSVQRGELQKLNVQKKFAIRRVLTPEQWKKLESMEPRGMMAGAIGPDFVFGEFGPGMLPDAEVIREQVRKALPDQFFRFKFNAPAPPPPMD